MNETCGFCSEQIDGPGLLIVVQDVDGVLTGRPVHSGCRGQELARIAFQAGIVVASIEELEPDVVIQPDRGGRFVFGPAIASEEEVDE